MNHQYLTRRFCIRNYAIPKSSTPIFVRSCGYYRCSAPFRDRVKRKQFLELFWVIRGVCTFVLDGKEFELGTNWTFFYLPGDLHQVQVRNNEAEYVWLTIQGEKLPELIEFLGITRGGRYSGNCPVENFSKLESCMRQGGETGEKEAGKLAFSLLADAVCGTASSNELTDTFKMLVQENIADPLLRVGSLAATLGVHRSTLHKIVLRETGLSPLEWITRCRMERAAELLSGGKLMIKEIADRCGIVDQNYFAKLVRRYLGDAPGMLRRQAAGLLRRDDK